jgi:hypothetical protein
MPIREVTTLPMRRLLLYTLALPLCCGVVARAQTTQPADGAETEAPRDVTAQAAPAQAAPGRDAAAPVADPWTRAVRALAAALVQADGDGADALGRALPAAAAVRRFDKDDAQDRDSLRDATAGAVVVSVLSYTNAASTVATDLALDIREAAFLPESVRSQFTIEGETAIQRANETAGHWVNGALQPGVQQPVGLIALWHPSQATMVFVLLKGRETAAGEHRVTYVVYGDMGQIVR